MSALLARLLGVPRWLLIAGAAALALGSHAAAYRLGGAHQFRVGFDAGQVAAIERQKANEAARNTRQLKDRLNAETAAPHRDSAAGSDGGRLLCGPSTRDCPR